MKKAFLLIAVLNLIVGAFAQGLVVSEPLHELSDKDALTNKVFVGDRELCALVKVGLDDPTVTFSGNVVRTVYVHGGWWVYMNDGSTRLRVGVGNNISKELVFPPLLGGVTYGVNLTVGSGDFPKASVGLSDEDRFQIERNITTRVQEFQYDVSDLIGSSLTRNEKEHRRSESLQMFIGKGEPYSVVVLGRNGDEAYTELHKAVQMCIIKSKYTGEREYKALKDYLSKLISDSDPKVGNKRYKKIVIDWAQAITIDSYEPSGNGNYTAVAHCLQKYTAYASADLKKPTYQDYTIKNIVIYINRIEVDLPDGGVGHSWTILLGDVDCEESW